MTPPPPVICPAEYGFVKFHRIIGQLYMCFSCQLRIRFLVFLWCVPEYRWPTWNIPCALKLHNHNNIFFFNCHWIKRCSIFLWSIQSSRNICKCWKHFHKWICSMAQWNWLALLSCKTCPLESFLWTDEYSSSVNSSPPIVVFSKLF